MVTLTNSAVASWIDNLFACMGGCFGCCTKPTPIIAVDEPTKGLKIQGRAVKRSSASDDFWSSSTCDLDNSAIQSQRSVSSISNQNLSTGVTSNSDFVNNGLILWHESRLQWTGNGTSSRNQPQQRWAPRTSWNTSYESLLQRRNPFPRSIPLSEMVDFLVEVWEQDGLYD